MSIGKNTRKPVAAASAMPRTIDSAKSDMEASAASQRFISGDRARLVAASDFEFDGSSDNAMCGTQPEEAKDQREHDREHDRRHNREIDADISAWTLVLDVAG